MTGSDALGPVQLLLFRFDGDARFEGQLVGALERMETGGTVRIVEALFIRHDGESGELEALDLRSRGAGSLVSPMLGFRLDPGERRHATERALGAEAGDLLRALSGELAPGAALAAVLVEHAWATTLEDAVSRMGGTPLSSRFVDASTLAELAPELVAAAGARPD
jgi:hypothetical protein